MGKNYFFRAIEYDVNQEQMKLHQYIAWLGPNVEEKLILTKARDFCMETKNAEDMRIGLEYLYMNGFYKDLAELIVKNKEHANELNNTWGKIFDLIIVKQKRSIPHHHILEEVTSIKTSDPGLQCIIDFLIVSIHFDMFEYRMLANLLDNIYDLIAKIADPLLSSLLNIRLDNLLFVYYWKRNEMLLARKYGFRAINVTNSKVRQAHLHINLSMSYILDDFKSSLYHLKQAEQLAVNGKIERLIDMIKNQNIPFIYAHFNRPEGIETTDISEQAHLEIAKGNFKQAQILLEGITEVTPFTKYYLGRAYQDRKLLFASYNAFIEQRSDHFFARLPLQALKDL